MLEGKYPRTRPLRRGDRFAARWQCDWHAILMEETTSKHFQLLREMVPKAARVAFIWNASETTGKCRCHGAQAGGALVEFRGEHGGRTAGCV